MPRAAWRQGFGPFLKGKVLLDARTSAVTTPTFDADALIDVVRRSGSKIGETVQTAIELADRCQTSEPPER